MEWRRTYAEHIVLERILAGSEDPKELRLHILERITQDFSKQRIIGRGGFGVVYLGVLQNDCVAVKRIDVNSHTIDDEIFKRELKSLLKVNHQNVVRFLGFCSNEHHVVQMVGSEDKLVLVRERLLCFEYISHGSLDKYITDELRGLEWHARYKIIMGICEGLQYLHNEKGIKHMDLKPANIMIDNHMVPKITDFGLARLDQKSRTTGLCYGTRWYCAPEYENDGKISFACDMYSLGVIIMELITGDKGIPNIKNVLRRWKCRWNELVCDKSPQEQQVSKLIKIAQNCTQKDPERRPSIGDVINHLNENGNTSGHICAVGQYQDIPESDEVEPREEFEDKAHIIQDDDDYALGEIVYVRCRAPVEDDMPIPSISRRSTHVLGTRDHNENYLEDGTYVELEPLEEEAVIGRELLRIICD